MLPSRVLSIDEAYNAVGWNTVFLLACLIPLGPAGYKVKDFVKSGSIMTMLFLVVSLLMLNLVF